MFYLLANVQLHAEPNASPPGDPKIVIVSDIDDSIRFTRIHHEDKYFQYWAGLLKQRSFTAMPALYHALAAKNSSIEYVSRMIQKITFFPYKFLEIAGFPVGPLHDCKDEKETLEDFKYRTTIELMRVHPKQNLF